MIFGKRKEKIKMEERQELYKVIGVARDGRQLVTIVTAKDKDDARHRAMMQPVYSFTKHGAIPFNFKGIHDVVRYI